MINECENCGGNINFSPKNKGNVCESCGSIFPVKYDFNVKKKTFEQTKQIDNKKIITSIKNLKCESCGANMVLHKNEIKSVCPYCGSATISEVAQQKILDIDSIIPFAFNRDEAFIKFNQKVYSSFFANRKIFKGINKDDFNGIYVNTFIFDLNTNVQYKGVFSYTETYRNSKGETKSRIRYRNVSGIFDKLFDNITIEANSHLSQNELFQILPYDYSKAVKFDVDFTHGYVFENHNEMFEDCFKQAENLIRNQIKSELLKKYNCDKVESLNLTINYTDKKYNYCLLPVYFLNKKYKDKNFKVLMNGQSGALSKLPKSVAKILLVIFMILGFVTGLILMFLFLV